MCMYIYVSYHSCEMLSKRTTACKKQPYKIETATIYPVAAAERCYVAVFVFVAFAVVSIAAATVPTEDSTKCAFRPRRNLAVCSRAHHRRHTRAHRNLRRKTFWTTVETQSYLESVLLSACPLVLPEPFPRSCHYDFIQPCAKLLYYMRDNAIFRSWSNVAVYIARIATAIPYPFFLTFCLKSSLFLWLSLSPHIYCLWSNLSELAEGESSSYLIHVHLFEATLENFEILYIFVLQIGLELDPFQRYAAWEEHVHELTIDRAGAQLFDLGERGLQTVVYPRKHVVTTEIVGCHIRGVHVNSHVAPFALTGMHRIID